MQECFAYSKRMRKFASHLRKQHSKSDSGCSAVRLAHLLWEQGVVGSNPATPTKKKNLSSSFFYAYK